MNLLKNPVKHKSGQEMSGGMEKLIKIINWQGRIIVLLTACILLVIFIRLEDVQLPSQEAVQTAPPLQEEDIQYTNFIYHNTQPVKHSETIHEPDVVIMGQVYDWQEVKDQWPDMDFVVNGAVIPLDQNGSYNVEFRLKDGANVVETGIRLNGRDLMRRQNIVIYEPAAKISGPEISAIVEPVINHDQ